MSSKPTCYAKKHCQPIALTSYELKRKINKLSICVFCIPRPTQSRKQYDSAPADGLKGDFVNKCIMFVIFLLSVTANGHRHIYADTI